MMDQQHPGADPASGLVPTAIPMSPASRTGPAIEVPLEIPPELANHPRYRIVRVLGRGGTSTVYLAEHQLMKRPVALKVINRALLADADMLKRFLAEVEAASRLAHANIVAAHDAEEAGSLHFLAMEYVEGVSLAEYLKKKGPLPIRLACNLARQVAEGLQHAHEQGMVHRDIKPSNLMLMKNGQVKILDFGLARLRTKVLPGEGLTRTGAYMGTPEYIPPEQARDASRADCRADIYGLGATLYCLLTGRPPFLKESALDVMMAHVQEIPEPLDSLRPEIPEGLSAVVARMLAKEPGQRYQTAEQVTQALAPFAGQEGALPPWPWPAGEEDSVGSLPLPEADVWMGGPPAERANAETVVQPATRKPAGGRLVLALVLLAGMPATAFLLSGDSQLGKATEPLPPGDSAPVAQIKEAPPPADGPAKELAEKPQPKAIEKKEEKALPQKPVRNRPALVDCTGKEGASAGQMRVAQEAWAAYLGRQVEAEDEIAPGVKMAFVLVPPGKFLMGSQESETERSTDETLHEVVITEPFYLGQFEVTQEQYEALTRKNPSHFKGPQLPVESVTWTQADDFGKRLTRNGRDGLLYRLPREAEWEYACRGGRPSSLPFGIGTGRTLDSGQANFNGHLPYGGAAKKKFRERTCEVGWYRPNVLGLFDMHGNVGEWCGDWYGAYPAGKVVNPTGPARGPSRVIRGGSWIDDARSCRAAHRDGYEPVARDNSLGFRLARIPPVNKQDP
jgi:formylglycine-generating enzyme required for sulfatase activity